VHEANPEDKKEETRSSFYLSAQIIESAGRVLHDL
jgi:hypothetical protein